MLKLAVLVYPEVRFPVQLRALIKPRAHARNKSLCHRRCLRPTWLFVFATCSVCRKFSVEGGCTIFQRDVCLSSRRFCGGPTLFFTGVVGEGLLLRLHGCRCLRNKVSARAASCRPGFRLANDNNRWNERVVLSYRVVPFQPRTCLREFSRVNGNVITARYRPDASKCFSSI